MVSARTGFGASANKDHININERSIFTTPCRKWFPVFLTYDSHLFQPFQQDLLPTSVNISCLQQGSWNCSPPETFQQPFAAHSWSG